jgi:carbon storage regulator CsrA
VQDRQHVAPPAVRAAAGEPGDSPVGEELQQLLSSLGTLEGAGIETVAQLQSAEVTELLEIPEIDAGTLATISAELAKLENPAGGDRLKELLAPAGEPIIVRLLRTSQQSILIGEQIEVKVLKIGRRHVKLGIDAPRTIAISRPPDRLQTATEADRARLLETAEATRCIAALVDFIEQFGEAPTVGKYQHYACTDPELPTVEQIRQACASIGGWRVAVARARSRAAG